MNNDIEVTEEMRSAGMYELLSFNPNDESGFEMAELVYRAMEAVRRS